MKKKKRKNIEKWFWTSSICAKLNCKLSLESVFGFQFTNVEGTMSQWDRNQIKSNPQKCIMSLFRLGNVRWCEPLWFLRTWQEEFKANLLYWLFYFLHRLSRAETYGSWDSCQPRACTQLITGSWWAMKRVTSCGCVCVCVSPSAFQNFDMCADF